MKKVANFIPELTLGLFTILLIGIRTGFGLTNAGYIVGDTNNFALMLGAFAKHLGSILSVKDSIALWNPYYLGTGVPTLSIISNGLLYPFNWPIIVTSAVLGNPVTAIPLYVLSLYIHLFVGSYFVYKLVRKFWNVGQFPAIVSGLLWMICGFNIETIAAGPVLIAASYLPICYYVLLSYIEHKTIKKFVLFFFLLACSFLIGYPMVPVLIVIFCFIVHAQHSLRSIKDLRDILIFYFIGFGLITLPLISPLYVTSSYYLPLSTRSASFLTQEAFTSSNPIKIESIFALLFPQILKSSEIYFFLGVSELIVLVMSVRSLVSNKRNIFLLSLGVVCFIISLGSITPLPGLLYYLPGINLFRRISIFSLITNLVLSILVGVGLSEIVKEKKLNSRMFMVSLIILGVLFFAGLRVYQPYLLTLPKPLLIQAKHNYTTWYLIGIGLVTFSSLYLWRFRKHGAQMLFLCALTCEALLMIVWKFTLHYPINPQLFFGSNELIEKTQELVEPMDRVDIGLTQQNYASDYFGLEQTGGYLPVSSQYAEKINDTMAHAETKGQRVKRLLGVKYSVLLAADDKQNQNDTYVTARPESRKHARYYYYDYAATNAQWQPLAQQTTYVIKKDQEALPRLFIAQHVIQKTQNKDLVDRIEKGPITSVFIDPKAQFIHTSESGSITIQEYKKNYIRAKTSSKGATFIANTTGFYPGWSAYIDGAKVPLVQTNWFMFGAFVPAGTHVLEFSFFPPPLVATTFYMIVSVGILCVLFVFYKKNVLK